MLHYNIGHQIKYTISRHYCSASAHPEVRLDFLSPSVIDGENWKHFVERRRLRVSFHPNRFLLFTSPREEVTKNAMMNGIHYQMLEAMGLEKKVLLIFSAWSSLWGWEGRWNVFREQEPSLRDLEEVMT